MGQRDDAAVPEADEQHPTSASSSMGRQRRNSSISTIASSTFSGSDGPPSSTETSHHVSPSCMIHFGHSAEYRSDALVEEFEEEEKEIGETCWSCDDSGAQFIEFRPRQPTPIKLHHVPRKANVTSKDKTTPHSTPGSLYRHPISLIMLTTMFFAYKTSPSFVYLALALSTLVFLMRILLRALVANPIFRSILLSHLAWKASHRHPLLPFVLLTVLPAIQCTFRMWNRRRCDNCRHLSSWLILPHPRHAVSLLMTASKAIFILSSMLLSALVLCGAYCIWDHGEPVALAALTVGLLAVSQCLADVAHTIRNRNDHPPQPDPLKETTTQPSVPGGTRIPRDVLAPTTCTCIRPASRRGIITTMTVFSLDVTVYACQAVSFCAWLLLWRDLNAHQVVLYVASLHHRILA